jgi:ABC-type transporter Mla MlaB component
VPPESNSLPPAGKPAVAFEINAARDLIRVSFAWHVSAAELEAGAEEVKRRLPQVRAGFSVLVDLTDLRRMDLDCVPHLAKIMDLFKEQGVGLVVRVDPDPSKDIGFNILSAIHYRGKVPVVVCDTMAEAARALKR